MRIIVGVLALSTVIVVSTEAQSSWVASLQGGYAVSTSTSVSFPGGGSFGVSAFVGRELGHLVVLGAEGGYYAVENTTTQDPACTGCGIADERVDWWQVGSTVRVGPTLGAVRPYGALGLAYYFGNRDFSDGLGYDVSFPLNAVGASVGGGVDWFPANGHWSLGGALRFHGLAGASDGEGYGGLFVTLLAGAGYRW